MKIFFKRTGYKAGQAILATCAFLLIVAAILQITFTVGLNLAATGAGTDLLEKKINAAVKESGYSISFDKILYDPVRGIILRNFSLSDPQGPFLILDKFSLSASLFSIPLRNLEVTAHGDHLIVLRLPHVQKESKEIDNTQASPFSLPDFYIKKTDIALSFGQITLGKDVAGKPVSFSPALNTRLSLEKSISVWMDLKPGLGEIYPGFHGPKDIFIEGAFSTENLTLNLKNLLISHDDYGIEAHGSGQFTKNGRMDFSVTAEHKNLSPLTKGMLEKFSGIFEIKGPSRGPALEIESKISPASLRQKGLGDINFSLSMNDIKKGMSGRAQIDTKYSDEPVTLTSNLSYESPLLKLSELKGQAPKLEVSGDGTLSTQTFLFDGKLHLSSDDLSHYKNLLMIDIGGQADIDAFFKTNASIQGTETNISIRNGRYDDIRIKKFDAKTSFPDLSIPWPQNADIQAQDIRIGDTASFGKFFFYLKNEGQKNYSLSIKGDGKAPVQPSFHGRADISNLNQKIPTVKDIDFTAILGKSSAVLRGDFSQDALDLTLATEDFRGRDMPANIPDTLSAMRVSGTALMTGTPGKPKTKINIQVKGLGTQTYRNASVDAAIQHDGKKFQVDLTGKGAGIRSLNANASFPLEFSLMPFSFHADKSAALSGNMKGDIDIAAISSLFIPPTQSLSGALSIDGSIGGTLTDPSPSGTLILDDVAFNDEANGIEIDRLSSAAAITKSGLTLNRLNATDGRKGILTGTGSVSFDQSKDTSISVQMRNFSIPRTNMANGLMDADLTMKGTASGLDFKGNIGISEMDIMVPETFQSRIPELNIIEKASAEGKNLVTDNINLAIKVNASNQIFVRGWGLDAEFGGEIDISGKATAPQFNGTLSSKRGRYEEFGKRFSLEQADLRFQGEIPPSPYLNVKATTVADDVTAAILLTGPVKSPSIEFSSTPALPKDEVLSRILFGKESARISPFQAVQLAQTIQRFSGQGGGFDPFSLLRSTTGLDDISIEMDESGETNVGVGKYLTDRVYLEVEKGKAENSGAAVIQFEVTPSVNIESRVGQDAQTGGGILWKHDY